MTQDELILQLLRAVAASLVCERCGGTGQMFQPAYTPKTSTWNQLIPLAPGQVITLGPDEKIEWLPVPCPCRVAVRDLLEVGAV
jgi:hypothetical protein